MSNTWRVPARLSARNRLGPSPLNDGLGASRFRSDPGADHHLVRVKFHFKPLQLFYISENSIIFKKNNAMKKLFAFGISFLCFVMVSFAQADTTGKDLAGRYIFPDGSVVTDVTVNFDNGALTMISSAGTSDLVKQSVDFYTIVSFQGNAAFKRDSASKKVKGVVIDAMGYHLEGVKDSAAKTSYVPLKVPSEKDRIVMVIKNQLTYFSRTELEFIKNKQFFLL
jgi:hypothetical protein